MFSIRYYFGSSTYTYSSTVENDQFYRLYETPIDSVITRVLYGYRDLIGAATPFVKLVPVLKHSVRTIGPPSGYRNYLNVH